MLKQIHFALHGFDESLLRQNRMQVWQSAQTRIGQARHVLTEKYHSGYHCLSTSCKISPKSGKYEFVFLNRWENYKIMAHLKLVSMDILSAQKYKSFLFWPFICLAGFKISRPTCDRLLQILLELSWLKLL